MNTEPHAAPRRQTLRTGVRRPFGACAALCLAVLVAGGCDDLLSVDNPSSILDEDLNTPAGVAALAAGVAGSFNGAFSNSAVWSALLSDEMIHTGTAPAQRNASLGDVAVEAASFNALSSSRWAADDAVRRFRALFDDADGRPEVASMSIYSGYALLLLADNHCQIPIDGGPGMTPAGTYELAEERFSTALAIAGAAGDAELQRRAYAGRARARLMLGRWAEAAADAQQVPDGFVFLSIHSETTQNNAFPASTLSSIRREIGVHPRYYEDVRLQNDPRVPFVDNDELGVDGNSKFVEQRKYLTRGDDMEIASSEEARLIEAEAEVRLGNVSAAVALINALRTSAGLDPYAGPETPAAVLEQIVYERQAELFLEGQRLADQRRFDDPWLAGRGTCFDISQNERNANPNVR